MRFDYYIVKREVFGLIKRLLNRLYINFAKTYIRLFRKNIILGKSVNFRGNLKLNCSRDGRIEIGDNVFFNEDCRINCKDNVKIGSDCLFGEGIKIYDHNHKFNAANMAVREQGYSIKPVRIGNNCWIGSNVIILAGTDIGDNTVVSAGCVISGTIPSNVIVRHKETLVYDPILFGGGRND